AHRAAFRRPPQPSVELPRSASRLVLTWDLLALPGASSPHSTRALGPRHAHPECPSSRRVMVPVPIALAGRFRCRGAPGRTTHVADPEHSVVEPTRTMARARPCCAHLRALARPAPSLDRVRRLGGRSTFVPANVTSGGKS